MGSSASGYRAKLRHGNELLSGSISGYEAGRKGAVTGYDLESIRGALDGYRGWSGDLSAFDCFTGLLVFDALVGNTDRHHENWAVIEDDRALAPSYDHGASLGFNATTAQVTEPANYADRARARHFGANKSPLQVARESLHMTTTNVTELWLERVAAVADEDLQQIVMAIPAGWMSGPRRTFVVDLVAENRRRLLR